jgi:hypothetical protein
VASKKKAASRGNERQPKARPTKDRASRTVAKPGRGVKRIWFVLWEDGIFAAIRRFKKRSDARTWKQHVKGVLYEAREVPR